MAAQANATAIAMPYSIDELDNIISSKYGVSNDATEQIVVDPLNDEVKPPGYKIMKASGNNCDCLIHAFLTCVSHSFRCLTDDKRNEFATIFRTQILPPFIENANFNLTKPKNDIVKQLIAEKTYLDDDILMPLGINFNINIALFNNNEHNTDAAPVNIRVSAQIGSKDDVLQLYGQPYIFMYNDFQTYDVKNDKGIKTGEFKYEHFSPMKVDGKNKYMLTWSEFCDMYKDDNHNTYFGNDAIKFQLNEYRKEYNDNEANKSTLSNIVNKLNNDGELNKTQLELYDKISTYCNDIKQSTNISATWHTIVSQPTSYIFSSKFSELIKEKNKETTVPVSVPVPNEVPTKGGKSVRYTLRKRK